MSEEEINIAIAEAHEWSGQPFDHIKQRLTYDPPDYCNDLNLMHEAEKTLSRGQNYNQLCGYGFYITTLIQICYQDHVINATASQRAEAFVRTIGKWKE